MDYCLLQDAFPPLHDTSSPSCDGDTVLSKNIRKHEQEKRKIRKGTCIPTAMLDPDRQHLEKTPPVHPMTKKKVKENFVENPNDTEGLEVLEDSKEKVLHPVDEGDVKSFANPVVSQENRNYANYSPDEKTYLLEPSFKDAFIKTGGVEKAGSSAMSPLPTPFIDNQWKPLTPSGIVTSFFKGSSESVNEVEKKIDILFSKLDDLQNPSSEYVQTEITMFISMGLMVMFMVDTLVRLGSK